ncbi:MAG TPA: HEAT repeat domain-containing protein [Gemmataceae bacterium]|nr:HEAT repeat domain-containing protein [Gemmataceae bacterium]
MEQLTPQVMHRLVFTILVHGLPDAQTEIAYEVLSEALKSPNAQVRELAVVAMSELLISPGKRVAALANALRDPFPRVRRRAARSLGDFGAHALPVLPQLVAGLRDPDSSVRRDCAGTLGRLGPVTHIGAAGLVAMLTEPETRSRVVAATALKRIGPGAIPALLQGLKSRDPDLKERSAALLVRIAPNDAKVAAAVRAAISGPLTETPTPLRTPAPAFLR